MRWIAIFTNKVNTQKLREAHLQAHLEYFSAQTKITLAGSTTPHGSSASNGGVWVIKDASYEEALKICEDDPFFIAGLRQRIDLFEYKVAPKFENAV
ncbi:MAG TPA: hypothetical protein ENK61_06385 [Devosia sp.]|nr:hypothetical protein [Devosia sp.]